MNSIGLGIIGRVDGLGWSTYNTATTSIDQVIRAAFELVLEIEWC